MRNYQKRMIEEHAQLYVRIQRLHDYVYGEESNKDDKIEFANKCIQLAAMKKYEEALRARLENCHIHYVNGDYLERVATVEVASGLDENIESDMNVPTEDKPLYE